MTSRERILKTLQGERPDRVDTLQSPCHTPKNRSGLTADRVPISLYDFDGFNEDWIHNYPEYEAILKYAEGKTDRFFSWGPISDKPNIFLGELPPDTIKTTRWREGNSTYTKTTVKTPEGEISNLVREDDNIHTGWELEKICKNETDAEKIMSLPYTPFKPPVDSFFELDKKLGETGIILGDLSDALLLTVEIFGFSRFLMLYTDNPSFFVRPPCP